MEDPNLLLFQVWSVFGEINKFNLDNPSILWYNGYIKDRRVCFMFSYKEGDTSKCL